MIATAFSARRQDLPSCSHSKNGDRLIASREYGLY